MSSRIRLPNTLAKPLPHGYMLLVSPTKTVIARQADGHVVDIIHHASFAASPRRAAILDLSQIPAPIRASFDALCATVGDDKVLCVFALSIRRSSSEFAKNLLLKINLPKRAAKLMWESSPSEHLPPYLIVGDRHGDIRSIAVPIHVEGSASCGSSGFIGRDAEPSIVRSEIDSETAHDRKEEIVETRAVQCENIEEGVVEEDHVLTPTLGHVSMLTDFCFISHRLNVDNFSAVKGHPPSYIVSSDRDEHIRISRWGPRRAAHIALRYLLGSTNAISCLRVIQNRELRVLRQSTKEPFSSQACRYPLLISSDAGCIRLWSLGPTANGGAAARSSCLVVIDVTKCVQAHLIVDKDVEEARGRHSSRAGAGEPKNRNKSASEIEAISKASEKQACFPRIVISHLEVLGREDGRFDLFFAIEGGAALFTLPLETLLRASYTTGPPTAAVTVDVSNDIRSHVLDGPVIDVSIDCSSSRSGRTSIWVCCDTRPEIMCDHDGKQRQTLHLVRWSSAQGTLENSGQNDSESGYGLVERCASARDVDNLCSLASYAPAEQAATLTLYETLLTLPKQESEKSKHPHLSSEKRVSGKRKLERADDNSPDKEHRAANRHAERKESRRHYE